MTEFRLCFIFLILPLCFRRWTYEWYPEDFDYGQFIHCCFGVDTLIQTPTKKLQTCQLKVGDPVVCADGSVQKILKIHSSGTTPRGQQQGEEKFTKKMVRIKDFWITRGHPFLHDGEWTRPDEIYNTVDIDIRDIGGIYNFVLEGDEHTVLVGDEATVCCTLGKYCGDRLNKLYPQQNQAYGTQFLL